MKKILLVLLTLVSLVGLSSSLGELKLGELKVVSPANVVGQPYYVRATFAPGVQAGTYSVGLEGHLELFGLNVSLGTYANYPDFSFEGEVYAGFGVRLGGLYAAISALAESLSSISGLSSFKNPQVAFGIVRFRSTDVLSRSWSRLDLSYLPNDFIVKNEDGNFKINESFDWTDATVRLVSESQDVGYFLFGFYTGKISDFMNGNYKYAFELALPFDSIYIYTSQDLSGSWKIGLGLVFAFLNAIGTYDLTTGSINWAVHAQF